MDAVLNINVPLSKRGDQSDRTDPSDRSDQRLCTSRSRSASGTFGKDGIIEKRHGRGQEVRL